MNTLQAKTALVTGGASEISRAGATYTEILDQTQHTLALVYLSAPQQNVSDITCLLGFSSCSSLTQAFGRWTGQSPSDLRAGAAAP
jgi:AraC-like DNA-binding protein